MRLALSYDDVLLVPRHSEIESRLSVSTDVNVGFDNLKIPIIASPMDTISEVEMSKEMFRLGGAAIMHRFMKPDQLAKMVNDHTDDRSAIPSVGVGDSGKKYFDDLFENINIEKVRAIAIDVANGHSFLMEDMIKYVSYNTNIPIIAGNVATADGYEFLTNCGVNAVRVGIGGGSICKTRIQTGFGVPTLQSVMDAYERKLELHESLRFSHLPAIIADGGIKYPKDLFISLAAGADAIMCGNILAGTTETPGRVYSRSGQHTYNAYPYDPDFYKVYQGMASAEAQGGLKPGTCAEGVRTEVQFKGPVENVINEFVGGLRSSMTYANVHELNNVYLQNKLSWRSNMEFVRITTAGLLESHAYGTRK